MKNRHFFQGFRVVFIILCDKNISYYELFNYAVSFCEHKKDDLSKKNISTEKANIP